MTNKNHIRGRRVIIAVAVTGLATAVAHPVLPTAVASPAASSAASASDRLIHLALPRPTGPYPLGKVDVRLVDHDRTDPWAPRPDQPRELMVSIWYPARHTPEGPTAAHLPGGVAAFYDQLFASSGIPSGTVDFAGTRTHAQSGAAVAPGAAGLPVLLYSPGGGQSRAMGTTLVEEFASRGYVVVAIDHTYAGPVEFPDRMEYPASGVDKAQMMRERVRDTSFVLDQLALLKSGGAREADRLAVPADLGTALDLSRVGMFGQSMGGFTAAEAMLTEGRISAGANLDGSMDPRSGEAANRGVDRPFLLMGGGTSGAAAEPHHHRYAPDWQSFWQRSTGWKRDFHLPEAEHMSFTDLQVMLPGIDRVQPIPAETLEAAIGTVHPVRSLSAQRAYLAAFFDQHLRGRHSELLDGDSPRYPEVRFVP